MSSGYVLKAFTKRNPGHLKMRKKNLKMFSEEQKNHMQSSNLVPYEVDLLLFHAQHVIPDQYYLDALQIQGATTKF